MLIEKVSTAIPLAFVRNIYTRLQANQNISCSPLRVAKRNTEDGVIQAARVYLEQLSILNIEISQMCITMHIWLKEKCLFDT